MNIKEIISNVTPEQLEKLEQNLGKVVPIIESKLPMLKNLTDAWRKELNVHKDDIFFYTAIVTPDNKKILIYIWTGFFAPEKITFSNGRVVEKNAVINSGEIKSFELMQFLRETTSGGLTGLIDMLM